MHAINASGLNDAWRSIALHNVGLTASKLRKVRVTITRILFKWVEDAKCSQRKLWPEYSQDSWPSSGYKMHTSFPDNGNGFERFDANLCTKSNHRFPDPESMEEWCSH